MYLWQQESQGAGFYGCHPISHFRFSFPVDSAEGEYIKRKRTGQNCPGEERLVVSASERMLVAQAPSIPFSGSLLIGELGG